MLQGIWHRERRKKTLWTVAAGLAVLVLAVTAAFFFKENRDIKKNPTAMAEATSERILGKVSKLYLLPEEKPTVAQIEDKSKLQDQTFFKGAENGDYLLVYPESKIALLYRENDNKLVNVGPVNTDQSSGNVAGENTEHTE